MRCARSLACSAVLDQHEAVSQRLVFLEFIFERLAQPDDSSHHVAEIVGETHRERAEIFFPRHVQKAAFGDGLARDVEPDAFVSAQRSLL